MTVLEKFCGACSQLKNASDFGFNRTKMDGLQSHCKKCRKKNVKGSVRKRKEKKIVNPLPAELITLWDQQRNKILPINVNRGSNLKAFWICPEGHSWQRKVSLQKTYCSECKILNKRKNLITLLPHIEKEWDLEKNTLEGMFLLNVSSTSKVHWKCEVGHFWTASISSRSQGAGCAKCAHAEARGKLKSPVVSVATIEKLKKEWSNNNPVSPEEVSVGSDFRAEWVCGKCSKTWITRVGDRVKKGYNCPFCSNRQSTPELTLQNFLAEKFDTLNNVRTIITPYELDIYVPDRNIAVEFNGVYWHSEEQGKGKWYHHSKWEACKEAGVQLIQVWEDEWNRNPELVKQMLAHKLGVSEQRKLAARDTRVVLLSQVQVDEFLDANHIQGAVGGGVRLGLVEKRNPESVVAVMLLKQEPGTEGRTLNLLRFATSENVRGGFTKLLTYVERTFTPESIITFSDNCVSDGGLYEGNGFVVAKELPPDYMYLVKGERVHKFGYRLKRFRNDPELLFKEGLSERELALLNGLSRVWDAGKTKWVKTFV